MNSSVCTLQSAVSQLQNKHRAMVALRHLCLRTEFQT